MTRWVALLGYVLTVPAANWSIGHVGVCVPDGPCLIPVWPGLWAPSGVLFAGLAFALRDAVQERLGTGWTLAAIGAGTALSFAVADPFVAVASASAFLLSELGDWCVYTPLRARGLLVAVAASNLAGTLIDSALFLAVAGFPAALLPGLVLGKVWTILPVLAALRFVRGCRAIHLPEPALS